VGLTTRWGIRRQQSSDEFDCYDWSLAPVVSAGYLWPVALGILEQCLMRSAVMVMTSTFFTALYGNLSNLVIFSKPAFDK
jgi:hypothetical protein